MSTFSNNDIISQWLKKKGWVLYEHQLRVINKISKVKSILLVAPTGTGKTLAGFLPSILDCTERKIKKKSLHTLYISPLKSLTYDIQRNLQKPINDMNLDLNIECRTGDTSYTKKKGQLESPPTILATTIESFALMMSEKNSFKFFSDLKYVVIDEVHSLINSKRGELLTLNLGRLKIFCKDLKLILLSATVADPKITSRYFCSNNKEIIFANVRKLMNVKILKTSKKLPWSGHMADHSREAIYKMILKKKCIIFVNTRAQAELLYQNLWKINSSNLKIALHHGSLEKKLRMNVEQKMSNGEIDCIVATSSLEMGLDWSNIQLVIQVGAPKGVTRLIQRIGRSNHTLKGTSEAILVPTNRFEFVECFAALVALEKKDLDLSPEREGSIDVLAQHILGVACSTAFDINELYKSIINVWPYRNLDKKTFLKIIDFLKDGGYSLKIYQQFSKLKEVSPGRYQISSDKFIKQYRLNVGTIIESQMLCVKLNNKILGNIEDWFIQKLSPGDTFLFGGKVLSFISLELNIVKVKASKSNNPKIPSYAGGRMPLSTQLSTNVKKIINKESIWNSFPKEVRDWLHLQKKKSSIPPLEGLFIECFPRKNHNNNIEIYYVFYTFEGKNANQTLGFVISKILDSLGINALGFVCTDYALTIWVDKKIKSIKDIFKYKNFVNNIYHWLDDSSLFKRNFRKVAIISGLMDKGYPNQKKRFNQVLINSDLIYKVLKKYEKDHILFKATIEESKRDLIELDRVENYIKKIKNKIFINDLDRPSPLSIPLILEINHEVLNRTTVDNYYLNKLEEELLAEVGLE